MFIFLLLFSMISLFAGSNQSGHDAAKATHQAPKTAKPLDRKSPIYRAFHDKLVDFIIDKQDKDLEARMVPVAQATLKAHPDISEGVRNAIIVETCHAVCDANAKHKINCEQGCDKLCGPLVTSSLLPEGVRACVRQQAQLKRDGDGSSNALLKSCEK